MNYEESYKLLKQYNKWRRGKGKKYSQPGFPFDVKDIGVAIDNAIVCIKAVVKMQGITSAKVEDEQALANS